MRRRWQIAGGVVLAFIGWLVAPLVFRNVRFFRVQQIEVSGAQYLPVVTIVDALALSTDANVFDDFGKAEANIRALPGVEEVDIGRRIPGTLRVAVVEAEPIALSPKGDRLVLVDARAHSLPFDPARSAPSLPVVEEPDSVLTAVLSRARNADGELFDRISAASRRREDVVLDLGEWRLWLRPDTEMEVMRAVMDVARDLALRGWTFQELDARFAGQIIVRGRRVA
ncbi:MAG: FtsQ-type POTRA domain-containing protein [Gemmatimonadales bacterium]|nr:FtsQ-type POTRA domain-containing protein [Gemmatimonadales bacterium]